MKLNVMIDELLKLEKELGDVDVTLLQCTDEDKEGNVEWWDADISSIEKSINKNNKETIVSIY